MKKSEVISVATQPPNYQRPSAVCQHFKIAASTLWYWAKTRPNFPAPIKAGARVTLFDVNQISAFITAQNQIQK